METLTLRKRALTFGSSLLVASMLVFSSCGDDEGDTPTPTTNDDATVTAIDVTRPIDFAGTELSGDISNVVILDASKEYTLSGGVHILKGGALVIPAGTKIKSKIGGAVAYLLVEKGGQLYANGTAASPVVFTSGEATPKRGDWGGIILCGKAPINVGTTATAEVGSVQYGGTVSADNSGVLSYVRVEYAGNAISATKEHNGFTFNGVGSATKVEYLQSFMGNDDGFEFFGGTVNASYLVSTGSKDDSFDWTQGWSGTASYWYAEQANDAGDRGIEADNNSDNNTASPYSNPTLSNVTLKGNGSVSSDDGVRLRVGTKGQISNIMIDNFGGKGIQVKDDATANNVNDGSLAVTNIAITNCSAEFAYPDAVTKKFTNGTTATGSGTNWMSGWTSELDASLKVATEK